MSSLLNKKSMMQAMVDWIYLGSKRKDKDISGDPRPGEQLDSTRVTGTALTKDHILHSIERLVGGEKIDTTNKGD